MAGVCLLGSAAVAAWVGVWWLWPGLVGLALYLLIGHVRLTRRDSPSAPPSTARNLG